ncbi:hypothetical protein F4775DRAFT_569708 [Biscogniauxia sp. FL1348]|nr:hypothetical protein F4775DRAFT_569708 [Biscogniauxia sp. FL1348]
MSGNNTTNIDPNSGEEEFKTFLREFKAISLTRQQIQNFENTTVEDVKITIAAIQQKQVSGKKQRYLKRLEIFLVNMENYGKVIEVFLNASIYLAFVWGPMKFMLLTACNFSEAFNSLLDAYQQIGEFIPQLQSYQELQHCLSNSYMRTVLALIYKDILEFHGVALKYFSKSIWEKVFQAVWSGFLVKLGELKGKMDRHKQLIESQASIAQFHEANRFRDDIRTKFQELQEDFTRRRWPEVHRWLAAYNSKLEQRNCNKAKEDCPGTGQWLLDDHRFKDWYDPIYCSTPLLWLNGIPGAGKTILASTIIDALPGLCSPSSMRCAYFYCKGDDKNRNTFVAVARGLLNQLATQDTDLLLQLYDKGNLQSGEAILSDPQMSKDLLEVALDSSQITYLIIDGIDECERAERKEICSWFSKHVNLLPREKFGNLRCLFVSRDDGPARKDLGAVPFIKLQPVNTSNDIKRYIMSWQKRIEEKHGELDAEKYPMSNIILASTQGMFLFAKLAVRYLYELPTRQSLLDSIRPGLFPEDMGALYDRILHQIMAPRQGQTAKHRAIYRLLSLLVCAKRPLKWYEIQGFFAFDQEDEAAPVDHNARRLRDDPMDLCLSLIERHVDDSIQLIHPTAKDHLIKSKYIQVDRADCEITQQILAYLSIPACTIQSTNSDIQEWASKGYYSFFDYAVACWALHIQAITTNMQSNETGWLLEEDMDCFLCSHWSNNLTDAMVSPAMHEKLKPFCEFECYPKLAQAMVSARKQLSMYGKGPTADDPLDLSFVTSRIRKVLENQPSETGNPQATTQLQEFYGQSYFKCPRINCIRFYDGFNSGDERDRHIDRHERPFNCGIPTCPMVIVGYSTEKTLRKHLFEFHGLDPGTNVDFPVPPKEPKREAGEGKYCCPQCPKTFTRAFTLRVHLNTHNNSRPHACSTCSREFKRQTDLKRHMIIHSTTRQFVCTGTLKSGASWGCKKAFRRADKLREHFQSLNGRRCISLFRAEQQALHEQESSQYPSRADTQAQSAIHKMPTVDAPVEGSSSQDDIEMGDEEWEEIFNAYIHED